MEKNLKKVFFLEYNAYSERIKQNGSAKEH
jgi:hypothetical protein